MADASDHQLTATTTYALHPSAQTTQVAEFELSALATVQCGFCRQWVHASDLADSVHGDGLLLTCVDCIEAKRAASRRYQRTWQAKLLLRKSRAKHRAAQRERERIVRAPRRAAQRARERERRHAQAAALQKEAHDQLALDLVAAFLDDSDVDA